MGMRDPFLGVKYDQGEMLTTHPHLVPREKKRIIYTSSPTSATMVCSGIALLYFMKNYCVKNLGIPKKKVVKPES
jgi:hypothetical protein